MTPSQIQATALSTNRVMNAPVLRTLLICDLADSTAMVQKLGDRRAADLMRRHDRMSRDLVQRRNGREIDKTDGFLILFERPIEAVAFALEYQRDLRELGEQNAIVLQARIGIHVGDIVLWENDASDIARGAKHIEVEGIAKSVAARLMGIARPGQILASGIAHTLAQRAHSELDNGHNLTWRTHGNYRFKGVNEPIQIFEVGEQGVTQFKAPAWSGKAHRETPWWRRPRTLAIEGTMLLAAVAVPLYFSLRSPAAIAFGERDWVVVGDLRNQTGQSVLDESLDTAFRISLEQSRFVNLLPALQTSDALKRMGKAAGTKIDRAIGAEIALRDGARALILPSISEVGGRVRITAEVVDPHTQATVYAETVDGSGIDSILPSVGKLSDQLRGRLGEVLEAVQANNASLPKVTTANLDALRAYALGLQAYAGGRMSEALELFQQATKLDPEFALAYLAMARTYTGTEDAASAAIQIKKAQALRDRLPPREQLYLDAWAARSGAPGPMLKKWQLLGQVYPDYYAASYNYAYFAWHLENRASDAIAAIQPALSEHNPLRGHGFYTLAYLEAVDNRFDAADEHFKTAKTLGVRGANGAMVATSGAQRKFDEARQMLAEVKPTGFPISDIFGVVELATLDVDQGRWQSARTTTQAIVDMALKINPFHGRVYRAMQLSLEDYVAPKSTQLAALKHLIADARTAMEDAASPDHVDEVFVELFSAYLAVRAGDANLAKATLDATGSLARGSGYPNLENMLAIGEAEVALRSGHVDSAIARLEPVIDGSELFLTHVALADAYTAAGRLEDALKQAKWLTEHRARAYMETNSLHLLQARNVVESSLALLRIAELNARLAKHEAQDQALDDFLAAWPKAEQLAFVSPRLSAIRDLSAP